MLEQDEPQSPPSPATIAARFLVIGTIGFGRGLAVIAQSLPGANAGSLVSYIGLRLRELRGTAVAVAFVTW